MTVPGFPEPSTTSEKGRRLASAAAMTTAALFWAIAEHLGESLPEGYSPVQTVWSRYFVHLLFMLALFSPRHGSYLVKTRRLGLQVSRALLMVAMPACFVWSTILLPLPIVWLISWSSVPMLLALSGLLLRERAAPSLWVAALCGWIGAWGIYGGRMPPLSWRCLAPVAMGLCFALYAVMTRRMQGESTQTKLFHTALWVFLILSLVVPFQWKTPTFRVLLIYGCIGLSGYLVLFFLDKSIELAPASLAFPLIYTVPVWYCAIDFINTGNPPGSLATAGSMIIAATSAFIVLTIWSGRVSLVSAH